MSMTGRHEGNNWFNVNIASGKLAEEFDKIAKGEGRTRSKHLEWLISEYLKNKKVKSND